MRRREGSDQENHSDPLSLIWQTLYGFDVNPLSVSLRGAIRIARLTEDYTNLWWLTIESIDCDDESASLYSLLNEMAQVFDENSFNEGQRRIMQDYEDQAPDISVDDLEHGN
jgi:hypothetical protein